MRNLLIIFFTLTKVIGFAQFGQFQALSLPSGARTAALGGYQVSLADGDVVQFIQNPALLDSVEATALSLNFNPYFAGVNAFSGAYASDFSRIGSLAFGLTYLNYGEFVERDASGNEIGTFRGQDFLLAVGKSHQVGSFTLGATMKFMQSAIASYGATAMAFDIGGLYRSPRNPFTIGMVFKNVGFVLSDYTASSTHLPFDVQIGLSTKPAHMPFRFTVTAYNLVRTNLVATDETEVAQAKAIKIFNDAISHLNVGTEFILSKNINLLFGYNPLRAKDLKLESGAYGAGFSYGLLIGIKKFKIRYSHGTYHAAGGSNFFAIETNLNAFSTIL